jgi:hypothetical protein
MNQDSKFSKENLERAARIYTDPRLANKVLDRAIVQVVAEQIEEAENRGRMQTARNLTQKICEECGQKAVKVENDRFGLRACPNGHTWYAAKIKKGML